MLACIYPDKLLMNFPLFNRQRKQAFNTLKIPLRQYYKDERSSDKHFIYKTPGMKLILGFFLLSQ